MTLRAWNPIQLQGYKIGNVPKLRRFAWQTVATGVVATAVVGAAYALARVTDSAWWYAAVWMPLACGTIGIARDPLLRCARQPLVYTARCKRLLICHAAVCAGVFVLLGWAGMRCGAYAMFLPLGWICALGLCGLSLGVMSVPEAALRARWVGKCKRELRARQGLIRIGITGSYGKTSVKLILRDILSVRFRVHATPSNYNTPLGICLTVRDMPADTQILIAEMGARHAGDIAQLCDIVRPSIGVVTGIARQHLQTFGTIDRIVRTKGELIRALPADGYCVCNACNPYVRTMYQECKIDKYGLGVDDRIRAERIYTSAQGSDFLLIMDGVRMDCHTCLVGKHNIENILLASAVAYRLGMTAEQIARGIAAVQPVPHRLQAIQAPNGVTVLDDSYNANEIGAKAALQTLSLFVGRKVVASQGLVELGARQNVANYELGRQIASAADLLIGIGPNRHAIAEGALSEGMTADRILHAETLEQAQRMFGQVLRAGDVVLIQNDLTDDLQSK